jgi:tetratricopeptide (TPR) repeat protein
MVPALVFGWLFSLSNIGWGLILYFFRPGHELLRQFPPIRIDWRPWMSIGIFILVFAIFLTGVAFNAIVLTLMTMVVVTINFLTTSSMQRGDYAAVLKYSDFSYHWLPYPNVFGYRQVAFVNSKRFDDALKESAARLAQAPRLASCLAEPLHAQSATLHSAKRYAEVLSPLATALRLMPDAAALYLTLADWHLLYAKNPARALEALDAGQPFAKAFDYNFRLLRARTYAHLGRFLEAEAELVTAEKMNAVQYPQGISKTSLLFVTGEVKRLAGDIDAARAIYQNIIQLDPNGNQAHAAREALAELDSDAT